MLLRMHISGQVLFEGPGHATLASRLRILPATIKLSRVSPTNISAGMNGTGKKIMLNHSRTTDDHLERILPAKKIPGRSPGMSSQIFEVFRELRKSLLFIAGGIRSLILLSRMRGSSQ